MKREMTITCKEKPDFEYMLCKNCLLYGEPKFRPIKAKFYYQEEYMCGRCFKKALCLPNNFHIKNILVKYIIEMNGDSECA